MCEHILLAQRRGQTAVRESGGLPHNPRQSSHYIFRNLFKLHLLSLYLYIIYYKYFTSIQCYLIHNKIMT